MLFGCFADEVTTFEKYVRTGDNFASLNLNKSIYISSSGMNIIEIAPINENVCKIVISTHFDNPAEFRYYTLYLKIGDYIKLEPKRYQYATMYTNSILGTVKSFDYNEITISVSEE